MAVVAWVAVFFSDQIFMHAIAFTVCAIFFVIRNTPKIINNTAKRKNILKGLLGERLVEEHLDEIRKAGFDVFHDVILSDEMGTENIDHVIIGPSGVFTLETKNWTAKGVPQDDRITFDGETLKIGDYVQDPKFLNQARRQAAKLQSILQPAVKEPIWVVPLLCFIDRFVRLTRFNPTGLQVMNQKNIGSFVLSREKRLDSETVRKLSAKLRELNRSNTSLPA